jgi:putative oxidoreductase
LHPPLRARQDFRHDKKFDREGTMDAGTPTAVDGRAQAMIAVGRITMGVCFVVFGLTKLLGIGGTIGMISTKLPFPAFVFWLAVAIETGLGLCLVLGYKARYAAAFFAFYVVFIGFVFHGQPLDRAQRDQALKNFVIAGGFLVIAAVGPGAAALDNSRRNRLPGA